MWKFEISRMYDAHCWKNGVVRQLCSYTDISDFWNPERTKEQLEMLKEEHFKKIELSDVILVINVDDYIGYSTNLEIEYAKKLNKEILYYTDLIKTKTIKV